MTCFVDTSAFLACLLSDDGNHLEARAAFAELVEGRTPLATTEYVLVETMALLQRRAGIAAARSFHEDILPLLIVYWVDEAVYHLGAAATLKAGRRNLSLVDCISFEVMARLGIRLAFAFDTHFEEQGFELVPLRKKRGSEGSQPSDRSRRD